jgi:uncharacterized protein (DUF433 family)
MKAVTSSHIESTPGVCGGKPCVAGTRIRVQDIVLWTEDGMSVDEIAVAYPHLTLADVHAALAYYHDHREQIDNDIRESDRFVADLKAKLQGNSSDSPGAGH